jgi:NSS family neurotransmitter:Na+ symporter
MVDAREVWSSRVGFIAAAIGSAVGLGSIWKFPYEVGTNGGSAFILFYLLGLVLIVLPLMLVEFAIGRGGRSDASGSIAAVARSAGACSRWAAVGRLGVLTSFLILSFYAVIGGWAIAYLVDTIVHGLAGTDPRAVQARFDSLLAAPQKMSAYHAAFIVIIAAIVARGIVGGIETACKILMPVLVLLLAVLAVYAMAEGDVAATTRFMFAPDVTRLTPRVALEALGLGFFSIGVGLCVLVTYAAHAGEDVNLTQAALVSIICDTTVSFLSGFAVFPVVFAHHLDPSSGPGLMFVSLPIAFAGLQFGTVAAVAFFALLVVAAVASAISLLEMPVALLQLRWNVSRRNATVISAAGSWLLGIASVLSFNLWAGWHPLGAVPAFADATIFDLLDYLTSNLLLPIGGIALAVFGGWSLPARFLAQELALPPRTIGLMRILLRYVAPFAITAVTMSALLV